VIVSEVCARSVLNKSGIERVDYAVNPYTGCAHACVYCYACFMRRFSGHTERWGTFVDAKVNAVDLLAQQMPRRPTARVMLSSVTDCYQPLEAKYRLTRGCLEVLARYPFADVSILTKSELVTPDIDLLREMTNVRVGMTLTTLDDSVAGWMEPGATPPSRRLRALDGLASAGIATWAFLGPLLPGISDDESSLVALLNATARAGVRSVFVDSMNLYPSVRASLTAAYRTHHRAGLAELDAAARAPEAYRAGLLEMIARAAVGAGIEVDTRV
jgi:DNA repair photolyase